jgi:uncharacterized delta-60 repeat protein
MCVARLTANGAIDTAFTSSANLTGIFPIDAVDPFQTDRANDVKIDNQGRILILGDCYGFIWTCVARLNSSGTYDGTFGADQSIVGRAILKHYFDGDTFEYLSTFKSLNIDNEGRLVLVGGCSYRISELCVTRLRSDGSFDTTFDAAPGNGNGVVRHTTSNGLKPVGIGAAINGNGQIVAAAHCYNDFGSDVLCVARLLGGNRDALTCALNADSNATIDSATDATLITRYLLGYRGTALTTGVLGANPTRTGQALEDHLASLNLDADGDGQALAMTDGLLMLRAMLGLTGDALTAGATNAAHPNARNAQQILTWIEQTHGVACQP